MAIRKSSSLLVDLAEAVANVGWGTITVYTGVPPLTIDDEPGGIMLYSVPISRLVVGVSGTLEKHADDIWSAVAGASGVAGWFRLSSTDGVRRLDGTLGKKGTDVILKSAMVDRGCIQTIPQFRLQLL